MRSQGLGAELTAALLGIGASTLRRHARRRRLGEPLRRSHGRPWPAPTADQAGHLRWLVRSTRGLTGAAALAKATGVSRRQAAGLKADVQTAIERERRARCARVVVLAAGVVRGFDAMHVNTSVGRRYILVAADAHVCYRTSLALVIAYDAETVARVLAADFETHGAPLVIRLDLASCHRADPVRAVIAAHQVLALHGPPHYPRFYGQIERQNRDHRVWLDDLGTAAPGIVADMCTDMRLALNTLTPRRTLGWRTADAVWHDRPMLQVDRQALRDDVLARTAHLQLEGLRPEVATRLAIEKALIDRNLLTIQPAAEVLRG